MSAIVNVNTFRLGSYVEGASRTQVPTTWASRPLTAASSNVSQPETWAPKLLTTRKPKMPTKAMPSKVVGRMAGR